MRAALDILKGDRNGGSLFKGCEKVLIAVNVACQFVNGNVLYCKQLGINYKNLSEEEFRWLIRILQKSKKMGTPISQRKKR